VRFQVGEQELAVVSYVTDSGNYSLETNQRAEAYYVSAVLNSAVADALLGPLRRRGQRGHPHVHKKIFDVAPIPQFDGGNAVHQRLTQLGEECSARVEEWLASGRPGKTKSIGKLRAIVRDLLSAQLDEIDALVKKILE